MKILFSTFPAFHERVCKANFYCCQVLNVNYMHAHWLQRWEVESKQEARKKVTSEGKLSFLIIHLRHFSALCRRKNRQVGFINSSPDVMWDYSTQCVFRFCFWWKQRKAFMKFMLWLVKAVEVKGFNNSWRLWHLLHVSLRCYFLVYPEILWWKRKN